MGPLVYTIKSGVLFCLFVMRAMRFAAAAAAAGRNGACGVPTESPRRGGVRNAGFVAVRALGEEIRNFEVFTGREMAGKWGKWPKLGKFQENHMIPTPPEIIIFGATIDLLKIKKWAKMHQNYQIYFLFFSVHVVLFYLYFCYSRRCVRQRCKAVLGETTTFKL